MTISSVSIGTRLVCELKRFGMWLNYNTDCLRGKKQIFPFIL